MPRFISLLSVVALFVGFFAAPALALPPDDYLGDSGIYVGVPNQRPKPNVLFVIDTSRATLNPSPGEAYNPNDADYNTGIYVADRIYFSDQQGDFNVGRPLGGNSPVLLSGVSCTVTDAGGATVLNVGTTLSTYGTYSGSGSSTAPNLGTGGGCATAPQGAVYATGHYLNYINTTVTPTTTGSCDNRTVVIRHGTFPNGSPRKYRLTRNIYPNALAEMEPGVGTDWELYWSALRSNDATAITHEINTSNQLVAGYTGRDGWLTGLVSLNDAVYIPACFGITTLRQAIGYFSWDMYFQQTAGTAPPTQRQAFYDALVPVIRGASASVNFGFLKYNPNNQGAVIGTNILSSNASTTDVNNLIAALPNMSTCTSSSWQSWSCPDTIASGPNRPQSEALYDAGYYFGATYEKTDGTVLPAAQQKINLTTRVPNPNPCGYNHIIFLTNGLPNQDSNTPNLGDWDEDGREILNNAASTQYGLGTHLLDDVAAYLHNEADVNGDGKTGDITTHVILAFQAEDDLLRHTADAGGGAFYNVYDTQGLTNALQDILANIVSESDTAFVAPVVPASSTNRTVSSNRVYLGLFKPITNAPWHGNLKKYRVSSGNQLLDVNGNPATNTVGDFIYSQSYWGTNVDGKIVSADEPYLRNEVTGTTPDPDGGDGGLVDAGGVGGTLVARDLSTRKIFTHLGGSQINLRTVDNDGNVSYGLTAQQLGFAAGEDLKRSQLTDFLYGYNAYGTTYTTPGQALANRRWILGDILHSKPLVFNYTKYAENVEGTCYDPTSTSLPVPASPDDAYNTSFVFLGANDGMMHAFRDCDGAEVWAFVPPILLDDLRFLPQPGHEYFVDGAPSLYVHDYDGDGNIESGDGDKVLLLFGLRRGGGNAFLAPNVPRGAYYALDVTNPLNPSMLWERSSADAGFGEMGETWSQPRLAKIKDGTTDKVVMFVGAGYDNNEDRRWGNTQDFPVSTWSDDGDFTNDTDTTLATNDGDPGVSNAGVTSAGGGTQLNPKGRGLYAIEIASLAKDVNNKYVPNFSQSGSLVWGYIYGASTTTTNVSNIATNSNMTFSIPSDLAVLDWDDDGYSDRIYVGDTGGQIWRFSLPLTVVDGVRTGLKANWTADVIFRSNPGSDSTNGRKFFYRPSVARSGVHAMLYFGSGDREHPLNFASHDRMYMLFDRGQGLANPADGLGVKTESNLIDVTANTLQESADSTAISTIFNALYADTNYGWYIRLENPGEKMLAAPVIFFGQAFYTTYAPLTSLQDNCEVGNLGVSRLYHLDFRTGEAVYNYVADNTQTAPEGNERAIKDGGILLKADRVRILGEGIPSGIVTLMDASGKVTMMISASNRVGTYSAPDVKLITPVYWMQWNN